MLIPQQSVKGPMYHRGQLLAAMIVRSLLRSAHVHTCVLSLTSVHIHVHKLNPHKVLHLPIIVLLFDKAGS